MLSSATHKYAGYARSYIILPGTVWGIVSGPLVDAKIQKAQSHQIPALIRVALNRKQAGIRCLRSTWGSNTLGCADATLGDDTFVHPLQVTDVFDQRMGEKVKAASAFF